MGATIAHGGVQDSIMWVCKYRMRSHNYIDILYRYITIYTYSSSKASVDIHKYVHLKCTMKNVTFVVGNSLPQCSVDVERPVMGAAKGSV